MRRLIPLLAALAAAPILFAQGGRTELRGYLRPGITAANDRGRVAASRMLRHVSVILQPSAAKQEALTRFLASQQDPTSPNYHHWLTPEQYGDRFGLAQTDIDQVTAWLKSQNLTVDSVGRGRTAISFSGNVRDVERALQTQIHNYTVHGESHFSNASEPTVPTAVAGFIRAIHGLDDFRMKPRSVRAANAPAPLPRYTSVTTGAHFLAPGDVAAMFDILPLYNGGITGKGQKIAVVGQTKIDVGDVQQFRTYFNLSANDPQMLLVPGAVDPGVVTDDLAEADLDVEWSGAVAPDASIVYVYSGDVITSLEYAIDKNVAPVISMSYGLCESLTGFSGLNALNAYSQQASAEGISWIAASGDNAANDCYGESPRVPAGASVDAPASVPGVTGVGGTTLIDAGGNYWKSVNTADHASALSYIPETAWNDGGSGAPDGSGGGASTFFEKPSWQVGAGVPADGKRDVPDVSMPASPNHVPYIVYSGGNLLAFGGTSVGAPVVAGIAGLLNQYLMANGIQKTAGLGPMNASLYAAAQSAPGAFHDVTSGDNKTISCVGCTTTVGFDAGTGYDQATGWGSLDAFNLATAWTGAAKSPATVSLTPSLTSLDATDVTTLNVTVAGGGAAPTGTVSFYGSPQTLLSTVPLVASGSSATAKFEMHASDLGPGVSGGVILTAVYSGDGVYGASSALAAIDVVSSTALAIHSLTSAASFQSVYAPGMVVALFGQNLAANTPDAPPSPLPSELAGTTVTVNGIPAPLYYVSPTQINLQIPWEIPKNSTAIVKVSANGQSATSQIAIAKNAPEVFADTSGLLVPVQPAAPGDAVFLFATGDGLFSAPQVVTGSVPPTGTLSVLPSSVIVRVGGVSAPVTFVGEPSWSVGVSQINFTIPANAPLGKQPVTVTIGGAVSQPVYITVTQ